MHDETRQNPYAPPQARVSDFKESDVTIEPASRGLRLGAAMIDVVVFGLVALPSLISVGFDTFAIRDPSAYSAGAVWATLALAIVLAVVTTVLVHRNGQTIGKKAVGIKVVRRDGSRASLGRIFWLRNFVNGIPGAIPVIGYVYFLVDSLFIFGARRRCIHDLIAGTIVINA